MTDVPHEDAGVNVRVVGAGQAGLGTGHHLTGRARLSLLVAHGAERVVFSACGLRPAGGFGLGIGHAPLLPFVDGVRPHTGLDERSGDVLGGDGAGEIAVQPDPSGFGVPLDVPVSEPSLQEPNGGSARSPRRRSLPEEHDGADARPKPSPPMSRKPGFCPAARRALLAPLLRLAPARTDWSSRRSSAKVGCPTSRRDPGRIISGRRTTSGSDARRGPIPQPARR